MSDPRLEQYLKFGQRFVNGWLRPGAAQATVLLAETQKRDGASGGVAEIGVHHGKLFIVLYLLCSGLERAVAIDLFSQQHLNIDHSGCGDLEIFRNNLRKYADTERLVVHEGDSTKLTSADLMELAHGPLRIVSIDGGHTQEITAHDLATAEGVLSEEGVIVLDDCFNEAFPGVAEGVFRYFSEPRSITPFAIGAGKTFFCKKDLADHYTAVLKTMRAKISWHGFLDREVLCLEFVPPTFAERVGKIEGWRKIKNMPPLPPLRRLYHKTRSLMHG